MKKATLQETIELVQGLNAKTIETSTAYGLLRVNVLTNKDTSHWHWRSKNKIPDVIADEPLVLVPRDRDWNEEGELLRTPEVLDFEILPFREPVKETSSRYYSSYNHWTTFPPKIALKVLVEGEEWVIYDNFGNVVEHYETEVSHDGENVFLTVNGLTKSFPDWKKTLHNFERYSYRVNEENQTTYFDWTLEGIATIAGKVELKSADENLVRRRHFLDTLLVVVRDLNAAEESEIKGSGISKTLKKIQGFFPEVKALDPYCYCILRELIKNSKRTIDSVKVSAAFNQQLGDAKSAQDIVDAIRDAVQARDENEEMSRWRQYDIDDFVKGLGSYKEKRRAALKAQGHRAFTKLMSEYESLDLNEKKYPKLAKAIKTNKIPIRTFFHSSEQYFLINDNWALWEAMLKRFPEETAQLAQEVSLRKNYEKDLMSYFHFVLYGLPKYLKKHTKEKWTCVPRIVDSPADLDPPEDDGSGTVRKRSAMTPVADNDKKVVTVPYVSLAMPGRQTCYTYALDFNILREGFSFKGNAVMSDLEEKLNGFDDFGLCFYTLTGSYVGRGYPTFLIIFERQTAKTVVHFHRVHPTRSKSGDLNPVHHWIKVAYNWMVGNVNKTRIKAQQGDLVFVDKEVKKGFDKKVTTYDKHNFETPVEFIEGPEKDKYVLGYVNIEQETKLRHTEHEDVLIPQGVYEVRQCRSFEANPKGIFSLRID